MNLQDYEKLFSVQDSGPTLVRALSAFEFPKKRMEVVKPEDVKNALASYGNFSFEGELAPLLLDKIAIELNVKITREFSNRTGQIERCSVGAGQITNPPGWMFTALLELVESWSFYVTTFVDQRHIAEAFGK